MEEARGAVSGFSDRVLRFLERIEHKIATTAAEREAAFQLRAEAYQRIGLLTARSVDRLYDPLFDDDPHAWTTMTFVDGAFAGTVRVNVGFDERAVLPGLQAFDDVLVPILRARQVVVEFTRLAAKLPLASLYPQLAYVIMRPAYMAAEHFRADYAVASPRAEHIAFYRRAFGADLWRPPREYPGLTAKLACMGADFPSMRGRIEARYPFYKSTSAEREALFGPVKGPSDRFDVGVEAKIRPDPLRMAEISNCA